LAGRTGAFRPLLRVAVSESHVLEGLGEHEQAASVARSGIVRARDYGLARSTGTFLAINVAEPLVSLGRWDEAIEVLDHALPLSPPHLNRIGLRILAGEIAVRRGDLADARAQAAAARTALGRSEPTRRASGQDHRPLVQLEAGPCPPEGRRARALGVVGGGGERFCTRP